MAGFRADPHTPVKPEVAKVTLSPQSRLEELEKENDGPLSWNLRLGSVHRKCVEIKAKTSFDKPSLSDRIRAESASLGSRSTMLAGDCAPLPSTSTVLPHAWSPTLVSPERSPLQDCTASPEMQCNTKNTKTKRWPEFEDLRRKMQSMSAALQRSNAQQAEMQSVLSEALHRGETLKAEAHEAKRLKERHQHKWCALDQEREALQRAAQQAAERAKASEQSAQSALEEAVAWRRWLANFLALFTQNLQAKESLHDGLQQLTQAERPSLEPELLSQMQALYSWAADAIGEKRLSVTWSSGPEVGKEDERLLQLERKLAQKEIAVVSLEQEKRTLRSEVRALQNLVQELRGSIRVFCRIRPPRFPACDGSSGGTEAHGSRSVCLRKPAGDKRHEFSFDRVFAQQASQRDLYEEVEPLLPGILEGIHVCIFAYGQTGAGKTYTLAGDRRAGEAGIQDLAIADLLKLASRDDRHDVKLTALEIYNESIQDLLSETTREVGQDGGERLEVRQSREGLPEAWTPSPFGSMRVPGLKSWTVRGPADVEQAFQRISANRHVASTALNERSSRSHCILSLSVQRSAPSTEDRSQETVGPGVLHIVDLAGSERTKISQAEGMQMKEANCINRSLSALADVLYALGDSSGAHIPFRNSKLTYLLQDALGGAGCKTFLFAQVSPEATDVNESYSTLTFASRVAANVQKGRLRPIGRGSPATRPNDASPRQRSQVPLTENDTPSMASPVLRARGVTPPLPGLSRKPT